MKKLGTRVWILIAFLIFSVMAINPSFSTEGVEISSVGDIAREQGFEVGEVISEINGVQVNTVEEFKTILSTASDIGDNEIVIRSNKGIFGYDAKYELGFEVGDNLTVTKSSIDNLSVGDKLIEINGIALDTLEDFEDIQYDLLPKKKLEIKTNVKDYVFLVNRDPGIDVREPKTHNIKKGLELEGGTRVLLSPISEDGSEVTLKDVQNLMTVLRNKLNIYGLSDMKMRMATSGDERYILVEMAGVSKDEIEGFISKQGKFEAKIGNETVFEGGKKDIPFVCKDDGTCSGINSCGKASEEEFSCRFQFSIKLSPDAAKKHADVTRNLLVVTGESGQQILEKQIEFYLDGTLVDALNIAADLKGSETTDIQITGPGLGNSEQNALETAVLNMEKLQTVLITGSLPFDLEIVELNSISPVFGINLIKNIFLVGIVSLLSVMGVIYIRYRNLKVLLPMAITLVSEIIIIMGMAAFIGWNLDLAAIAGIIAAVGTGVDDQIVITDEIMKGEKEKFYSWKEKIKRAFYIIIVAYFSTVVAMMPLWGAAAGLLRGFAITTIIGVTIGVFVTRPAFASMLEKMMD